MGNCFTENQNSSCNKCFTTNKKRKVKAAQEAKFNTVESIVLEANISLIKEEGNEILLGLEQDEVEKEIEVEKRKCLEMYRGLNVQTIKGENARKCPFCKERIKILEGCDPKIEVRLIYL